MKRVFLKLSYKGTNFFGWQVQPNQVTVQGAIEDALTQLNSGKEVKITGCGRTDTGVHASMYFAHVDLPFDITAKQLKFKLNGMLPKDIAIQKVIPVKEDAHARFDATSRTYNYFIHLEKDPFTPFSWQRNVQLDIEAMNKACLILKEYEDFECFSKVKTDVTNFNCSIQQALWVRSDKGFIFTITANRFLRNMVRAILGTMIEVGEGKMSLEEFRKVIESKDRSEAGLSVPANGLFLAAVSYPYISTDG